MDDKYIVITLVLIVLIAQTLGFFLGYSVAKEKYLNGVDIKTAIENVFEEK